MGAGAAKAHESYAVSPGIDPDDLEALLNDLPAGELDHATPAHAEPGQPVDDWADAVTPVPEAPPAGLITGVPILVGGADLEDSAATLVAYDGPGGPREVLLGTVNEAAEAKLLEALALSEEKLIAVTVDKEVLGRLPVDESQQLWEQLQKVVKSVNHHVKVGDDIPEHTHQNLDKLVAQLGDISADPAATDVEKAMAAHYLAATEQIAERLTPGYSVPYLEGGKVGPLSAYETTGVVAVTEYVPAPADHVPEGLLATSVRNSTRLRPTVTDQGTVEWDGKARSKAGGKEYVVDLGDGYQAVYRPYAANDPAQCDYSLRGSLEVIAPQGDGHGHELVRRLGQLNLVNRPMNAAEGEWAYLTANIHAQRLDHHKQVATALAEADGLEDAVEHKLFAARKDRAIGMTEAELHLFAKEIRLDAEAAALPDKVRTVRDALAHSLGLPYGDALATQPGYDPTPRRSGGWLVFDRYDVASQPLSAAKVFGDRGLCHRVTGANLLEVLRNGGVLASTERRRRMGITTSKGMSEGADMKTGGARSVFLRLSSKPSSGPALYWADPTVLLRRADWYAYNGDHFGSLNSASGHSTKGQTRDPKTLASFGGSGNEVMFKDGIDLLGAEAPSLIRCASSHERSQVLALLAERGISHLGGKPIEEVVAA